MAQRKDLEVGQERELFTGSGRSRSQFANLSKAHVRILALDQLAEVTVRDNQGSHYDMRENYVLVQVLAEHGWTYDDWSSMMERERPLVQIKNTSEPVGNRRRYIGQRRDPGRSGYGLSYTKFWSSEKLPEGQYLVATKLLGDIWDPERKQAEAQAKADYEARKARYDAAVEAQGRRLSELLTQAGVSTSRWRGGRTFDLSYNDLARLITNLTLGNVEVDEVHWKDYSGESSPDQV